MIETMPWQNAAKAGVESSPVVGYSEKRRSERAAIVG